MAVVTVRSDALVAFFCSSFQTNNNSFLTDVEVAEATNQAHAV